MLILYIIKHTHTFRYVQRYLLTHNEHASTSACSSMGYIYKGYKTSISALNTLQPTITPYKLKCHRLPLRDFLLLHYQYKCIAAKMVVFEFQINLTLRKFYFGCFCPKHFWYFIFEKYFCYLIIAAVFFACIALSIVLR